MTNTLCYLGVNYAKVGAYVNKLKELQVDELAGALLLSIKIKDSHQAEYNARKNEGIKTEFKPIEDINLDSLKSSIKWKDIDVEDHDFLYDVLYALMEATQFLINHGFLAHDRMNKPGISSTIYTTSTCFLTRKADTIETISDWKNDAKRCP